MKILVLGNGGREHAIIRQLSRSPKASKIYCTIGNAGIDEIAESVSIKPDDAVLLREFAINERIDLTVVGPEIPLAAGVVDEFMKHGLKIFGPNASAARLENSKVFAKEFMLKHGIPTAQFAVFTSDGKSDALKYLETAAYPAVIKADGLAAGKGVVIAKNIADASLALKDMFENHLFGSAGDNVVIEQFLTGNEASIFAVCDGTDYVVLPSAQDHKKIGDGETGKNTGGMGSYAPADKLVTPEVIERVKTRIIEPVLKHMKDEGNEFKGCLYCGLMIDESGDPYVIEFNTRFGDPETQVVLPLIRSDLVELFNASAEGKLKSYRLDIHEGFYACVVMASSGYPDKYETGKVISGLDDISSDAIVFHAGTKRNEKGEIVSSGGRVLNVVGRSDSSLHEAINSAYENVNRISFENEYFRTDIGVKGL